MRILFWNTISCFFLVFFDGNGSRSFPSRDFRRCGLIWAWSNWIVSGFCPLQIAVNCCCNSKTAHSHILQFAVACVVVEWQFWVCLYGEDWLWFILRMMRVRDEGCHIHSQLLEQTHCCDVHQLFKFTASLEAGDHLFLGVASLEGIELYFVEI